MKNYTTLLFDADMTLFDFEGAEASAFGIVMTGSGIQYTDGDFCRYKKINASLWESFGRGEITKEYLQSQRFTRFLKTLDEKYTESDGIRLNAAFVEALADCSQLFDGAEELCRKLSGRYELYIVTNGVSRTQKKRFEGSAIRPYFRDIFVSEDAGAPKPMKAYFDYVFAHIGEERRGESLIIGDSPSSDIAGGINAGIGTVWYNPGGTRGDGIRPDYTVRDYTELESLLL